MKHRYRNKRHRGPNHRGLAIRNRDMEGNIPVLVAYRYHKWPQVEVHIRGFYLHPTKGWRSTGPEGRR